MPDKNIVESENIVRRLDAIIALLVREGKQTVGDRIVTIKDAGLRPIEIGRILGRPLSNVTATITMTEKRRNKKRKRGA